MWNKGHVRVYFLDWGSPNYGPRAKSGPRNYFIQPQRHFVNNEKNNIFTKKLFIWYSTCNISRNI